jgi:uncharacterized cupredoxin-like copper-binding protein
MVRIMVPLDGSPFAESALDAAIELAQRMGAELHLVQVHEFRLPAMYAEGWLAVDPELQAQFAREMANDDHGAHADESVEPGETASIDYTFTEAGDLLAGCHQPGHYEGGMVARISVGE